MASLWEALKQYVSDVAPGGVLSPETPRLGSLLDYGKQKAQYIGGLLDPNSQVSQDVGSWHKKTQLGLADLLAGKETPAADYGYGQMMNMAGVAPLGLTAWHGSPHKFDKFSLDKIGTGEGAQAYGHGLYLAETPEIAGFYKDKLSNGTVLSKRHLEPAEVVFSNTGDLPESTVRKMRLYAASYANKIDFNDADSVKSFLKVHFPRAAGRLPDNFSASSDLMSSGNLYKTDIPDEAVARFLDWDKPLSQQAPEVLSSIKQKFPQLFEKTWNQGTKQITDPDVIKNIEAALKTKPTEVEAQGFRQYAPIDEWTGMNLHHALGGRAVHSQANGEKLLQEAGIPGIRYLDGGSRSAGQGSSNFVSFDPEMIRILERNGVPTGQQPWKPGEWQGLLGR